MRELSRRKHVAAVIIGQLLQKSNGVRLIEIRLIKEGITIVLITVIMWTIVRPAIPQDKNLKKVQLLELLFNQAI